MERLSVKDDQQQVLQNLSLPLSLCLSVFLSLLAAQQCREALLPALVFYGLLHRSLCCRQIAAKI